MPGKYLQKMHKATPWARKVRRLRRTMPGGRQLIKLRKIHGARKPLPIVVHGEQTTRQQQTIGPDKPNHQLSSGGERQLNQRSRIIGGQQRHQAREHRNGIHRKLRLRMSGALHKWKRRRRLRLRLHCLRLRHHRHHRLLKQHHQQPSAPRLYRPRYHLRHQLRRWADRQCHLQNRECLTFVRFNEAVHKRVSKRPQLQRRSRKHRHHRHHRHSRPRQLPAQLNLRRK